MARSFVQHARNTLACQLGLALPRLRHPLVFRQRRRRFNEVVVDVEIGVLLGQAVATLHHNSRRRQRDLLVLRVESTRVVAYRWRAARQEHATTMFVRFRTTPRRLQVSVLETRRAAGKVTNEHIASLGSIEVPMTVGGRQAFWANLWERLPRLSNRIGADDQTKIRNTLHARIPMVMPDEANEDEAKYWETWSASFAKSGALEREHAADAIKRAEAKEGIAAIFANNRPAALKGERPMDHGVVGNPKAGHRAIRKVRVKSAQVSIYVRLFSLTEAPGVPPSPPTQAIVASLRRHAKPARDPKPLVRPLAASPPTVRDRSPQGGDGFGCSRQPGPTREGRRPSHKGRIWNIAFGDGRATGRVRLGPGRNRSGRLPKKRQAKLQRDYNDLVRRSHDRQHSAAFQRSAAFAKGGKQHMFSEQAAGAARGGRSGKPDDRGRGARAARDVPRRRADAGHRPGVALVICNRLSSFVGGRRAKLHPASDMRHESGGPSSGGVASTPTSALSLSVPLSSL
jgi:hypothetical protein